MKLKTKSRSYRMQARSEKVAETRARIVEATMALHGEVGPRHTTISSIAERAGVERLTVYRHFPDEAAVFAACSHRFTELNPPPDPANLESLTDPCAHTQEGLGHLYGYFSKTAYMLDKIYRDVPDYPSLAAIMEGFDGYLRAYADQMSALWPACDSGPAIALRHAVRFSTWQSLDQEGINDHRKAGLMLRWTAALNGIRKSE